MQFVSGFLGSPLNPKSSIFDTPEQKVCHEAIPSQRPEKKTHTFFIIHSAGKTYHLDVKCCPAREAIPKKKHDLS